MRTASTSSRRRAPSRCSRCSACSSSYGAVVPLLLGLAVAVVPLQLGARAIAFPASRSPASTSGSPGSCWRSCRSSNKGGPGGSDRRFTGLFLTSTAMIALGLLAAALCVATSVLTTRTPGMRLLRVPAFAWASLIGAVGLLLTLPVLIGDVIYLFVDYRHAQAAFFGGSGQGIMSWAGWAFTQPQALRARHPGARHLRRAARRRRPALDSRCAASCSPPSA